jgi:hypothetical protein
LYGSLRVVKVVPSASTCDYARFAKDRWRLRIHAGSVTVAGEIPTSKLPSFFGRRRDALTDFRQQFPSARRVAALLAHHKAGFCLAFRDDVRDKVVKQPLQRAAPSNALCRELSQR